MWKRLETFHNNLDTGMTQDRYFSVCEQMGKEPNINEIPPAWDDFPEVIIQAFNIFNQLGDRVYPEIGYMGKDYTNLPILIEIMGVDNKEILLETLNKLDTRAIKKSSENLKKEYDKMKRKSSGKK